MRVNPSCGVNFMTPHPTQAIKSSARKTVNYNSGSSRVDRSRLSAVIKRELYESESSSRSVPVCLLFFGRSSVHPCIKV